MANDAQIIQVVLAHSAFVKALAVKLAPWPGLADDIAQQVFLEFLSKEGRWDLTNDLKPLLATMTRHVAMRCWKERTRQMPEILCQLAEHVRKLAEQSELAPRWEDETVALRKCLESLPKKSRTLIDRHYFGKISTPDIAKELSMKNEAVRQAICRIRSSLRQCIESTLKADNYA